MAKKPTLLQQNLKKPSLEDFMKAFNKASDSQLKPLLSKSMIRRMERIMKK
tara:strand:- start:1774 stop:1926 length:153 start_codon:yes stop_codon:yes gene_type:complete